MDTGMEMQVIKYFDMPTIGTTYSKYNNKTKTLEKLGELINIRYFNENGKEEKEKVGTIQNVELYFDNKKGPIYVVKYRNNKITQKLVNSEMEMVNYTLGPVTPVAPVTPVDPVTPVGPLGPNFPYKKGETYKINGKNVKYVKFELPEQPGQSISSVTPGDEDYHVLLHFEDLDTHKKSRVNAILLPNGSIKPSKGGSKKKSKKKRTNKLKRKSFRKNVKRSF